MSTELKLTEQELTDLQKANEQLTKFKLAIGELELQKNGLLSQVNKLQIEFSKMEDHLVEKYGKDSMINLKTGDVTKK
jgi:hypothetical protein|tara:strand:+ start:2994 stop:3227 length:234 start_codon:yes stop_codon:yes gene_type:complete